MTVDLILAMLAVFLGAAGTYLLLPHKHGSRKPRNVHYAGAALSLVALALFASIWGPSGDFITRAFFYAFGLASVAGAVLTVTARDPIHSALWFAAVVLATSGLFLLAGAQFLAAGTVIVYAGAIIVTFLFVIMLAQMEGRAPYDRAARIPFRATWTCYLLFFGLIWSLLHVKDAASVRSTSGASAPAKVVPRLPRTFELVDRANPRAGQAVAGVLSHANRPTALLNDSSGRPKPHVAGLGETLYTDHLVTVELAGGLLFVALIGALAIATPKPPVRPSDRRVAAASPGP